MRRFAVSSLVLGATLAGCSPNAQGIKVITEQCIADGEAIEVCECLGTASSEKLDKDLFDMVVLGAQGAEAEVAGRMEDLQPEMRAKFAVVTGEIRRTCDRATAVETPQP
jgi:hypothetical protein